MIDTRDWEFFDFPKVFRMENGFYNNSTFALEKPI